MKAKRKPGRPRVHAAERSRASIIMDAELWVRIDIAALDSEISRSQWVANACSERLRRLRR